MAMSVDTAAYLRIIKRDADAIATGRLTGGSARAVGDHLKYVIDQLLESAANDQKAAV